MFVHGEYWNAEGDTEIDVGEKVEVVGSEGMVLKVRRPSQNRSLG
ncbi:MAG: NfeD family protein [Candidatus Binatia bacterium]